MKSEHPADFFTSAEDKILSDERPIRANVPEIKTLFDERNNRPFKLPDTDDDSPTDVKSVSDEKNFPDEPTRSSARQEDDIGFFGKVHRMTSIKPAVEDKIKNISHYVTLSKTPKFLQQAIVSVEDARFYDHKGFDMIGIARATLANAKAGEIREGASTITQQTVKNLFLTSDKTFARKFEELVLSMNMEKNFDKDQILEIYLNSIYFGSDFYGIYDAAHGYFNKEPAELNLAECAILAGLPNAPSLYSPYVDFHKAKERQLVVIEAMRKAGIISEREAESARVAEIILAR